MVTAGSRRLGRAALLAQVARNGARTYRTAAVL
jgi:hypothetical protein